MRPIAGCMRKAATISAGVRRGSPGWRFVTWVALLAFTLQSFVTQTHIHWSPHSSTRTTVALLLDGPVSQNASPFEKDKTACPFCQAIIHAGAFFASGAPLLLLPVLRAEWAVPRLFSIAKRAALAHSWQSRAPPQH
jgi:hypothetical protein